LEILAFYMLFSGMRQILFAALNSMDEQWKWVSSQIAGVVLGIVSGFLLIPKFSYIGAAYSLLISECFAFVLAYSFSTQKLGPMPWFSMMAKPLAASAIMGIFVVGNLNKMSLLIAAP